MTRVPTIAAGTRIRAPSKRRKQLGDDGRRAWWGRTERGNVAEYHAIVEPWIGPIETITDAVDESALSDGINIALAMIEAVIPVEVRRACFALPMGLDPMVGMRILILHAYPGVHDAAIARLYGVTKQRIGQIHRRLEVTLRKPLRAML